MLQSEKTVFAMVHQAIKFLKRFTSREPASKPSITAILTYSLTETQLSMQICSNMASITII